jgi:hypothetical protein
MSKNLLPKIHSEWQLRPSFSVYMLNAKAVDADRVPISLSGLPVTINFENGGLKQVVTTNQQGESIFIGPSGKFSVYGINPGDSVDGGMTKIDLVMNAKTGGWLVNTTPLQSPITALS